MKTDIYTKIVLTVIAVMLSVIAGKQMMIPTATVAAASSGKQFVFGANGKFYFYTDGDHFITVRDASGGLEAKINFH